MSQKNLLLFHLGNPLDEVITAFLEGSDTDIHFARDKQHAIELLKVHDIGVVCCTASGPGSPGFDFLRYMMRQFPLVQRVYMSDHFTVEEMELAVNKAHINYYIHLPAEQEKFAKIIHKAFKRFRAVSRPGEKLSQLADITIELMTDVEKYHDQALTDELTGLFNRRSFQNKTERIYLQFERNHSTFSIALLDIDKFKYLNDTYGHPAGDQVLSGFARLLRSQIRENEDMAFRLGGDEFAILAPNTSSEELEKLMQRIVNVVRNAHFDIGDVQIRFTLSVGISQSHDKLSMADIIKRADTALYRAKENGRDRIIRFQ